MEHLVQFLERIFVTVHPYVQLVVLVGNYPNGFANAVGYLLGTDVRKILGFSGYKGTVVGAHLNIGNMGWYGNEENKEIRFTAAD